MLLVPLTSSKLQDFFSLSPAFPIISACVIVYPWLWIHIKCHSCDVFKRTHLIREKRGHCCNKITSASTHYNSNTSRARSIQALGTSLIHVVSSVKYTVLQCSLSHSWKASWTWGKDQCSAPNTTQFYSLIKMCKARLASHIFGG